MQRTRAGATKNSDEAEKKKQTKTKDIEGTLNTIKEEDNAEVDDIVDDGEQNCMIENDTTLPFCEIKVEYGGDETSPDADNGDELVHLEDDDEDDDVYGDYSCQKCNLSLTTWNMLKRHVKSVHDAIECFKCKICLKVYNKASAFESHAVAEHGTHRDSTNDFLEKLTLYRVSRGTSFYTRVKRSRNNDRLIVTTFETMAKILSCSHCDYKSKNKRSLATHVAKHLNSSDFKCKTCGRVFKIQRHLSYHVRLTHREEKYICNICGKTYRRANALNKHRRFTHFDGKLECDVCHRLLANQKNLNLHVAACHCDDKKVEKKKKKIGETEKVICDACGKIFSRPDILRMHMRVHTGERPYACPVCKETFAKSNALKQHLLLHTGAKPYVCDICGKAFAQKPGLTGHRKSHPGPHPPLLPVFIDPLLKDVLEQCEQ